MKRNNRLKNRMTRIGYEHPKLDDRLLRVRKSADELNKLLENMTSKDKENKENEKK